VTQEHALLKLLAWPYSAPTDRKCSERQLASFERIAARLMIQVEMDSSAAAQK
jgi:hypothetical protein